MKKLNIYLNQLGRENSWILTLVFSVPHYIIFYFISIRLYIKALLMFIIFMMMYENEINILKIIKEKYIVKLNNQKIIEIVNNIGYLKWIILGLIVLIFMIFVHYINRYDWKKTKNFLLIFLYHRINFLINMIIFTRILKISFIEFFNYNFIIMIIFIIVFLLNLVESLILKNKKANKKYKLLHFLNLPLISILIWIIIFISDEYIFFKYRWILQEYDKKYYEINIHLNEEE